MQLIYVKNASFIGFHFFCKFFSHKQLHESFTVFLCWSRRDKCVIDIFFDANFSNIDPHSSQEIIPRDLLKFNWNYKCFAQLLYCTVRNKKITLKPTIIGRESAHRFPFPWQDFFLDTQVCKVDTFLFHQVIAYAPSAWAITTGKFSPPIIKRKRAADGGGGKDYVLQLPLRLCTIKNTFCAITPAARWILCGSDQTSRDYCHLLDLCIHAFGSVSHTVGTTSWTLISFNWVNESKQSTTLHNSLYFSFYSPFRLVRFRASKFSREFLMNFFQLCEFFLPSYERFQRLENYHAESSKLSNQEATCYFIVQREITHEFTRYRAPRRTLTLVLELSSLL